MVIVGDVKHDISDLVEAMKACDINEFFSNAELEFLKSKNRDPKEEMSVEFSLFFINGWEKELLKNGKVFSRDNKKGISNEKELKEVLKWDGEIRFYAESKKTEDIVESLRKKGCY